MQSKTGKTMGLTEWLLLFFLSIIWGGSFFFGMVALDELQPFTVVMARVIIAGIVLNIVVRAAGHKMPKSPRIWGAFAVMGLINNLIPFSLIFWGETQISSSLASILNATTPVWSVLLAHFFAKDEKLTSNRISGVVFGLVGVVVMLGFDALSGLSGNILAQIAVLVAAFSYAVAGLYGRRFKGIPALVTATGQITCTAVMSIPVALIVDNPWLLPMPSAKVWGALVGLAVLSTALAYIIYFHLLSTAGPTNLLLVTFLIPVSAIFLGIIILGEQLDPRHFLGMGLIGLGLMFIDGRLPEMVRMKLLVNTD
jgi:drug/metabolite transporter (DMT)-like permease